MTTSSKIEKRRVDVKLIEQTPDYRGLGQWILASPMILFIAWLWIDIFNYYSPLPRMLDYLVALVLFVAVIVLPFGLLAHRVVTGLPKLFHHAGWDVQALEPIAPEEQYLVKYVYQGTERAQTTWRRRWLRAAQGWVYLEIAAILVGAVAMIPLFFSATEFGFGQ